jgi:hypothetical protein
MARRLAAPFETTGSYSVFSEAVCVNLDGGGAGTQGNNACECLAKGGSLDMVGPVSAECATYGRNDCLWTGADFAGCTLDADCRGICDELSKRRASDAMQIFPTTIRQAECSAGECSIIVQVGSRCYAQPSQSACSPDGATIPSTREGSLLSQIDGGSD